MGWEVMVAQSRCPVLMGLAKAKCPLVSSVKGLSDPQDMGSLECTKDATPTCPCRQDSQLPCSADHTSVARGCGAPGPQTASLQGTRQTQGS